MKTTTLTVLLSTGLLFGACSTSSSSNNQSAQTIGKSGGTVSATSGVKLVFPPNALASNVKITVAATPNAPTPASTVLAGTPYTFGPEGTQFAQPVTITLPVANLPAGTDASQVVIYTAAAGSTAYTPLSTTMLDATHVTASTSHFSVFVPAVPSDVVELPADLATAGQADLKTVANADMAKGNCTITCTYGTTSGSCNCTGSCSGKTYYMGCSDSGANVSCYCEIDGLTQDAGGQTAGSCGNSDLASTLASPWSSLPTSFGCGFPGTLTNAN